MASNPKVLSIIGKGLKLDTREDIKPHLSAYDPAKVEEIHLGGNTIGIEASEELADFLKKTEVLKIADFADIFTGRLISEIPQALTAICDALKDKTSLVEINLSDNAFGGRSVDPIVPLLTHNRSFQILKLNNNGLGPAGGAVLANALLKSAEQSKAEGKKSNLRTLICGRNRLENGSANAWADAFAAHGGLEEVRMPQNGIRMDGITALARGLSKNPNLRHVDFQDNTFTEDGASKGLEAWTEALQSWPELHTLNLSDCVLSNEGEVPILLSALATGSNGKLHTLQLQNNNLESQTFSLLADSITSGLASLMRLELQDNDQDDDDEHLETIALSLKQRGGKLFAADEEEEEEEEEEEQEEQGGTAVVEPVKAAADLSNLKVELRDEDKKAVEKAADDLAELMSKVGIS